MWDVVQLSRFAAGFTGVSPRYCCCCCCCCSARNCKRPGWHSEGCSLQQLIQADKAASSRAIRFVLSFFFLSSLIQLITEIQCVGVKKGAEQTESSAVDLRSENFGHIMFVLPAVAHSFTLHKTAQQRKCVSFSLDYSLSPSLLSVLLHIHRLPSNSQPSITRGGSQRLLVFCHIQPKV